MYVRDIMKTNVVTIPSSTSIADAKRIMDAHRFRRLPVVDKGKLVGIVTERRLESVSRDAGIRKRRRDKGRSDPWCPD